MPGTQRLKDVGGTPVAGFDVPFGVLPVLVEYHPYDTPNPTLRVTFSGNIQTTGGAVNVSGWTATRGTIAEYASPTWADLTFVSGTINGATLTLVCTEALTESSTHDHTVAFTGLGSNLCDKNDAPIPPFSLTAPKPVSISIPSAMTMDVLFDGDLEPMDYPATGSGYDLAAFMSGEHHYAAAGLHVVDSRTLRITWEFDHGPPPGVGVENVIWMDAFTGFDNVYGANGFALAPFSISTASVQAHVTAAAYDGQTGTVEVTFSRKLTANAEMDVSAWTDLVVDLGEDGIYSADPDSPVATIDSVTMAANISGSGDAPGRITFTNVPVLDENQLNTPGLLCSYGFPVLSFTDFSLAVVNL